MNKIAKVYWIHESSHTDMRTEGYIGFTTKHHVKKRINEHVARANIGAMRSVHLENAIRKYGIKNLNVKVLCIGTPEYCLEIEKKLRPEHGIGWNLAIGGDKPAIGRIVSEETREKLRKTSSARIFTPEWRAKLSTAGKLRKRIFGRKLSEETKEKIRQANIGKKYSIETKAKQSAARLGKSIPKPLGFGKKMSVILKERFKDPEIKKKMSNTAKERSARIKICPHCGTSDKMIAINRWHMNNCKKRPVIEFED